MDFILHLKIEMGLFDVLWAAGKDVRNKFAGMSYSVKQGEANVLSASEIEEENVDQEIEENIEKLTILVNTLDEMRENVSKCCKDYVELKLIRNEVTNKSIFGPSIPSELGRESKNLLTIGDFLSNKKDLDVSVLSKALADRVRKQNMRKRKLTESPKEKEQKYKTPMKNEESDYGREDTVVSKKARKDEDVSSVSDNEKENETNDDEYFDDVNLDAE